MACAECRDGKEDNRLSMKRFGFLSYAQRGLIERSVIQNNTPRAKVSVFVPNEFIRSFATKCKLLQTSRGSRDQIGTTPQQEQPQQEYESINIQFHFSSPLISTDPTYGSCSSRVGSTLDGRGATPPTGDMSESAGDRADRSLRRFRVGTLMMEQISSA